MIEGLKKYSEPSFEPINRGYNSVFVPNRLTLGLVVPLENYDRSPVPTMEDHLERIQLAESLGFAAVWLRDVPFNVDSFGDAGQLYDPFVYLGLLAGQTERIALGVASIVLPLRHPAHVAKAAASVDQLSGGRLLLGVASGDRPEEYPAMNLPFRERGKRFRASYDYIRNVAQARVPFENSYGSLGPSMELLPKPKGGKLPLLITGGSQQSPEWLSQHGDGWMTYPRHIEMQEKVIAQWRNRLTTPKPVMQPLYVDLVGEPEAELHPIHLGFRCGSQALVRHLKSLERIGVNHVAINLRFQAGAPELAMSRLAEDVLSQFPSQGENS